MEKKSFYWWVVYVFMFSTVILMMVHIDNKKLVNKKQNYAVSFVNKQAFVDSEFANRNLASDTVDSMAIFKKILSRTKLATNDSKTQVKENNSTVSENKPNNTSSAIRKKKPNKVNKPNISNNEITPEINAEKHEMYKDITTIDANDKNFAGEDIVNEPIGINSEKKAIKASENGIDSSDKGLITIKTDNAVTENTVYQGLAINDNTIHKQSKSTQTNSGNPTISNLLQRYNQNLQEINVTESTAADVLSLDLTNSNLVVLNQISGNSDPSTYQGPMHALGNGAGQDGLNEGGGTDNGITYNDTALLGSLPMGDGSKLFILFLLCYIIIIGFRQNIKNYKLQN